jgi:hypothetical protein
MNIISGLLIFTTEKGACRVAETKEGIDNAVCEKSEK